MQEKKKLKGGRELGLGGGVMSVSLEAATLSVHFWNKSTFLFPPHRLGIVSVGSGSCRSSQGAELLCSELVPAPRLKEARRK